MFKTDDRVIQICLFLTGLIFMLYAGMMAFNTGAFLDRYPTFDNDATNRFFVVWFGLNNIMFLAGIYYMGYKGLDKGYFVFLIPASILNIVWIVMSHQATGGENYTGLTMVSIGLLLTLIADRDFLFVDAIIFKLSETSVTLSPCDIQTSNESLKPSNIFPLL